MQSTGVDFILLFMPILLLLLLLYHYFIYLYTAIYRTYLIIISIFIYITHTSFLSIFIVVVRFFHTINNNNNFFLRSFCRFSSFSKEKKKSCSRLSIVGHILLSLLNSINFSIWLIRVFDSVWFRSARGGYAWIFFSFLYLDLLY